MNSFGVVINYTARRKSVSIRRLYKELIGRGVQISRSMFYRYVNDESVPSVIIAKQILEGLDIVYDDRTLNEMLEETARARERKYQSSNTYITSISLQYRKLSDYIEDENQIQMLLDKRVDETSDNFSDYICRLIKKDLDEQILERKDDDVI